MRPLKDIGTDRFCAVEVLVRNRVPLYVVSVYMPQAGCVISDFETQMDALEACISQWQGQVLLAGDWNAHFSADHGQRGWGTTSRNAKFVLPAMQRCSLVSVDMSPMCNGPTHTYCNSLGHSSYIDHCIVSASLVPNVKVCSILPDEVSNTSDHLPLYISLEFPGFEPEPTNGNVQRHIMWHKLSGDQIANYSMALELLVIQYTNSVLHPTDVAGWSQADIEETVNSVIYMTSLASAQLWPNRARSRAKPYGSMLLTRLVQDKKAAWRIWTQDGKPRNVHSQTWREYQDAKKTLRRELRSAQYKKDLSYVEQVEQQACLDQRAFWALINKKYKPPSGSGTKPFLKPDGTILTGEDQIREAWKEYFEDLYTPKNKPHYDEAFREEVEERLSDIVQAEQNKSGGDTVLEALTVQDVSKACKLLKAGKAPGADGVQPEHLKHAGKNFLCLLTKLYNAMIWHEWRPQVLKRGIIVTIPEGAKDKTLPDNNRGITLMPVLGKVIDLLLLKRVNGWITSTLDDLQGANRTGISSLETAACLKETIAHNANKGNTVYVALLDVKKAFDLLSRSC